MKLEHTVAEEVRQALPQAFRDRTQADPATNSLVVTAAEGVVERIVEEIRRLDQPPYQLRIDALVTEINSHGRRTLGLDWSWLDDQRRGIGKGSPADIGNLAGNVLGLSFVLDMRDFLINLRHAVEQGDATIRANPSVVTLEGKPASLFVGNVTYYVIDAGEGAQTTISRLEAIEAGVTLEILARVSDDGVIVLEVAPSVSDVQGSAIQDGTLPVIGRRQVKTTVRVRDGETLALGGLLQQREVEQRTRVPILGDLPIFGRLFSSTRRSQEETEVLVFITPTFSATAKRRPKPPCSPRRSSCRHTGPTEVISVLRLRTVVAVLAVVAVASLLWVGLGSPTVYASDGPNSCAGSLCLPARGPLLLADQSGRRG